MTAKKGSQSFYFEGFDSPNTTPVPDVFFDFLAPNCSEAELRVLIYVIRRTFGFKKNSDAISLSQLESGITTRDGRVLDIGTGMSRKGVVKGCAGLVEKGILIKDTRRSEQGDNDINVYRLRFKTGGNSSDLGVGNNGNHRREQGSPRVGNVGNPQETGSQETDQQQTEISSNDTKSNLFTSNNTYAQLSTSIRKQRSVENSRSTDPLNDDPASPAAPTGWSKLAQVAEGLVQRRQSGSAAVPTSPGRGRPPKAPPYLAATIEEITLRLNDDPKHVRSNTTRATRLWKYSGLPEDKFVTSVVYHARSLAQQQGNVTKRAAAGAGGPINRVPYFFAVVEDLLGLKGEAHQ